MPRPRPFCADESRALGEQLHATASRVDHWLLIEYRSLWSHDAFAGSGLSEQVKQHLRDQQAARPRTRLLFIRSRARRGAPRLAAYSATSREREFDLRRVEFDSYTDLLGLDLAGGAGEPVDHPLLLVCTHVGGDRFAGNLVCLPRGLYYGRLDGASASAALDELLADRIYLEPYRGRSCYPFAVQAAERAVREDTGLLGLDELQLVAAHRRNDGAWTVAISASGRGIQEVDLREEHGELEHLTCSSEGLRRPRRFVVSARRARPGV